MKRIYSWLTSMPFMGFLMLALAFAMGMATFIESSFGTPAAQALIYKSRGFELIWALLALNLVNNLLKYRLFSMKRFPLGIFHVSFLVILLGAAITRYFSYEGVMHIREDSSANFILSSDNYFYAGFENQQKSEKVLFSELTPKQFSAKFDIEGEKVRIKTVGFISNAERKPIPSETGKAMIDLVLSSPNGQGMQTYNLSPGDVLNIPGFTAGFGSGENTPIRFFIQDDELFMTSVSDIEESTMARQESVSIVPGDTIRVKKMFLYGFGNFRFLIRNFYPRAVFTAIKSQVETHEDAVLVQITEGSSRQVVPVFGHSSSISDTISVPLENGFLKLAYGAMPVTIPFSVHLKKFQLERYPGSDSPSSFASDVVLVDSNAGLEKEFRIFMNNTLNYKGFKFFQSSYDTDEKGTILSVSHDFLGTSITYLGYALMILGMFLSLIHKNSYFRQLTRRLKKSTVPALMFIFMMSGIIQSRAQTGIGAGIPDIDREVVKNFSELWVQGVDGRIEPVSTLSSEIVRKITHKSSLFGKSSDEVVLSMIAFPEIWRSLPIILVSNKTLADELGASGKFITIQQLFDAQGNYRISENVREAYNKTPAFRNRVEKEYINIDERVNICFMVSAGTLFPLYPRPDAEAKWHVPGTKAPDFSGADSVFIESGFQLLAQMVAEQKSTDALQFLQAVAKFRQNFGGTLIPSETKKKAEIFYNNLNPFKRIFPYYLMFGFLFLFVLFVNIFRQKPLHKAIRWAFTGLIFATFLIHTAGLIIRWYISGHAPWSNGYESVVYVAWASMFAGFIFGRKYPMVIGTAAFLAGIALFVAHLSWMNPEVTNLVPVLKSYWLTIHVAIITASYGFIGLSTFLGILVMFLIILRNQNNETRVTGFIVQLTTINEMSATIGLYFLTIGTFLGGVWANESWGRYWGWDPKETWALVTVVVYAFIVHMRLIPSLKGYFNYNVASIFGIITVLMTYFGVNYYLTGLHSYGKGVVNGINPAVPFVFLLLVGLIIWASVKDTQYEKSKTANKD